MISPDSVAVPVVTIDGPSGVGKGTLCRMLGAALGWHILDSGALYRVTALAALKADIALDDTAGLVLVAQHLAVEFRSVAEAHQVLLAGEDVTTAMLSEACGNAASKIAILSPVRQALLERQRAFRQTPGLITDGRDMGTVVFPDALVKIFLSASAEERALRRYKQLKEKGIGASLAALAQDIAARDQRDAQRSVAPLRPAADAIMLDTTGMSIQTTYERALMLIQARL